MAIAIREDETEAGGFALLDLGRDLAQESIRLSFQRRDADPRHLGMDGWQSEIAWHDAGRVTSDGSSTVVRIGPAVVDWIDELVPVQIVAEGVGSFGTIIWPQLTRSPRGLSELRIRATTAPRSREEPRPPSRPAQTPAPTSPVTSALDRPQSAPGIAKGPEPTLAPPVAAPRLERKKKHIPQRVLAALLFAVMIAGVPFILLRMGYYELVVDVHGPLDFIEHATVAGSPPHFTPASTRIDVHRARWASWFEGWWLTEPPPAAPAVGVPWLTALIAVEKVDVITFIVAPDPRAFPSGVPRLQTPVAFRNTVSGFSSEQRLATIQRAPGSLVVESASGAIFTGPQGGPFTPPQVAFILAAAGLGFNWSIEGTLPPWLEATPIRGELRDNGSTAAVVKLRPAAQTLSPGTYDAELAFRKEAAAAPITQAVRLVIEGPGRLTVDPPVALVFIGPQGGPFMPLQIAFHLGAVGRGFKWKLEGTIPFWLEATPIQGELRDNGSAQAVIELRPAAQSLAPGTYDASLIFKKEASGDPITRSVRLIVEPQGALRVDPLAALVFTGSQGGPFTPPQIAINLAAEGRGFKWLLEGRIPFWLEVTPVRGELRDNGSATVVVQLEPTAQSLAPGTHDAQLTFNKEGPGDPITRTVRVVVKP